MRISRSGCLRDQPSNTVLFTAVAACAPRRDSDRARHDRLLPLLALDRRYLRPTEQVTDLNHQRDPGPSTGMHQALVGNSGPDPTPSRRLLIPAGEKPVDGK